MSFGIITFRNGHDLAEGSGDNSLSLLRTGTHHCVSFSTSGLPIRKNGTIIAVKDVVNEGESSLFVDESLQRIGTEDKIIGKGFRLLFRIRFVQVDLIILRIDGDDRFAVWIKQELLIFFYLSFMGRHLTITLTVYDIQYFNGIII